MRQGNRRRRKTISIDANLGAPETVRPENMLIDCVETIAHLCN